MSLGYRAVAWNNDKKRYDLILTLGCVLYLGVFIASTLFFRPNATAETIIIRAFGTLAILLLHVVLCIGPLCRLNPWFLPILRNRRHLGVATFLVGLTHGVFALIQFHALGDRPILVSLLVSNTRVGSLSQFPFELLGAGALAILFLMAATSHDFWLHNLGPTAWKRLHMLVYLAYVLLIGHVVLGALQTETNPVLAALLSCGVAIVISLHLLAGIRERRIDNNKADSILDDFIEVCEVSSIPEKRAKIVLAGNERVAVFRYDGKISAIGNVCRHQGGPLGEGRIIDGCVTCPWHGYQYLPESGASPPPFTEKVASYRTRLAGDKVFVHRNALPPGTLVTPSVLDQQAHKCAHSMASIEIVRDAR